MNDNPHKQEKEPKVPKVPKEDVPLSPQDTGNGNPPPDKP